MDYILLYDGEVESVVGSNLWKIECTTSHKTVCISICLNSHELLGNHRIDSEIDLIFQKRNFCIRVGTCGYRANHRELQGTLIIRTICTASSEFICIKLVEVSQIPRTGYAILSGDIFVSSIDFCSYENACFTTGKEGISCGCENPEDDTRIRKRRTKSSTCLCCVYFWNSETKVHITPCDTIGNN